MPYQDRERQREWNRIYQRQKRRGWFSQGEGVYICPWCLRRSKTPAAADNHEQGHVRERVL